MKALYNGERHPEQFCVIFTSLSTPLSSSLNCTLQISLIRLKGCLVLHCMLMAVPIYPVAVNVARIICSIYPATVKITEIFVPNPPVVVDVVKIYPYILSRCRYNQNLLPYLPNPNRSLIR